MYRETINPENMTFSELYQFYPREEGFSWSGTRLPDGQIVAHASDFDYRLQCAHGDTGSFWYHTVSAIISTAGGKARVIEYDDMSEDYSW